MVKVPDQQVVGSFMYAMLCVRLDLAYPISVVNQHMANLSLEHWIVVKCIFSKLARHFVIQITFWRITTPRFGRIL